jgi:hypothetical protein
VAIVAGAVVAAGAVAVGLKERAES